MTSESAVSASNDDLGDCVDAASVDSFPASDAPAWATGRLRLPRGGSRLVGHSEIG
jgi:hypothetical protein